MEDARKKQFAHLAAAKEQLEAWAVSHAVSLERVDFVVPFVETDFSVSVWLFYETDDDVARCDRAGSSARMQEEFLALLNAQGYPAQWLSEVVFVVDSREKVERNYEGSYFNRLR